MLSGFFDDIKDESDEFSNKRSSKSKSRKNDDSNQKYDKHINKDFSRKSTDDRKHSRDSKLLPTLKDRSRQKKYPSPQPPPLPSMKPIKNLVNESKTQKNAEISITNSDMNESAIVDALLSFQKKLIDRISNFRTDSLKQIDLMMEEMGQIKYSCT